MTIQRRMSSDLAKVLKANSRGRLLPTVERFLADRPKDFRRTDILHPSALSKKDQCVRSLYLNIVNERGSDLKVGFQLQRIFDEGHLIHDKWQKYFAEMGVLYGTWRCEECHRKSSEMSLPPRECEFCGSRNIKYAEVPLEVPQWQIAGHADGWTKGIGADTLLEFKSVGTGTVRIEAPDMFEKYQGNMEDIWKNIRRPFPSHINQAQLYLAMAHEMGLDAPKEIVFIYENKFNQGAKEFPVPYQRSHVEDIIDTCCAVKYALDEGEEPTCFIYNCKSCKAAE